MPKKKVVKLMWRTITDVTRPELFRVTALSGDEWRAHLIVDGSAKKRAQFPVVTFTLQRWRATHALEKRTFQLQWWFTDERLIRSMDVVTLREMDEALCEDVEDKFLLGGERMVGDAVKSLGDDLSFLGWVRILLPRGCEGWSAWDMPERQAGTSRGWTNAMVITPDGLPFHIGWSLTENRWSGLHTAAMTRLREECPEEVLEKVAQYLSEEYNPHLQSNDEVA